jgi:hypothetical protein
MVGGLVLNPANFVMTAGEVFGFAGVSGCPHYGIHEVDMGYQSHMIRQQSTSAVSTMLCIVDPAFLVDILESEHRPHMSLPFLGAWAGAHAYRTGKRIVFSPYVRGHQVRPVDWQGMVPMQEKMRFVQANADLIPDVRFYPRFFSLDPGKVFRPVTELERQSYLRVVLPYLPQRAITDNGQGGS